MSHMISNTCLNRTLFVLLAATAASYATGESGASGWPVALTLLALAFLKSRLVINEFMGLRLVHFKWRALMLGWLVAVLGLIALAYWKGIA